MGMSVLTQPTEGMVNAADGSGLIVTDFVMVTEQVPLEIVRLTVYVPGLYTCDGFCKVEVSSVPLGGSPKFHDQDVIANGGRYVE